MFLVEVHFALVWCECCSFAEDGFCLGQGVDGFFACVWDMDVFEKRYWEFRVCCWNEGVDGDMYVEAFGLVKQLSQISASELSFGFAVMDDGVKAKRFPVGWSEVLCDLAKSFVSDGSREDDVGGLRWRLTVREERWVRFKGWWHGAVVDAAGWRWSPVRRVLVVVDERSVTLESLRS